MTTFNVLTILVASISILANIWIARYNAGKNRKIYGVTTLSCLGGEDINRVLNSGDYTILHVEPPNPSGGIMYVLGKLER